MFNIATVGTLIITNFTPFKGKFDKYIFIPKKSATELDICMIVNGNRTKALNRVAVFR